MHTPGEIASNFPLSSVVLKDIPRGTVFTYTGEYRKPQQGDYFITNPPGCLICSYDGGDWGICWIVKPESPRIKHTVCFTDGQSIKSYHFYGDVNWMRLESDLISDHAIEATVTMDCCGKLKGYIHLSDDGWKGHPLMGKYEFTYFKGWFRPIGEYALLMQKWRKNLGAKPTVAELFTKYNELGDMMRKLFKREVV